MDPKTEHSKLSAQGVFSRTPVSHVLMQAWHQRLTGTFEFEGPSGLVATLLLSEGRPTKARTAVHHYLVNVLEQLGVLNDVQLEHYLPRLLATSELHGIGLVRRGILTQPQVDLGLRAQLVRQMQTVLELAPETAFRFYNGVDALVGYGAESQVRLDPFPFVWASLKSAPPRAHMETAMERIGDRYIKVEPGTETTRFGFDPATQAMIGMLQKRGRRLGDLASVVPAKVDAPLVVYCLVLAKQVDFVDEPAPEELAAEERAPDSWLVPASDSSVDAGHEGEHAEPSSARDADATPEPGRVRESVREPARESGVEILEPSVRGFEDLRVTPVHAAVSNADEPTLAGRYDAIDDLPEETTAAAPLASAEAWRSFTAPERDAAPPPTPQVTRAPAVDPRAEPSLPERPTAAPPPGYEEPRPPPPAEPGSPGHSPIEEDLDAFARPTVPRMTAVTPAEVAAYIAQQEAAAKAKESGARPSASKAPALPRPPTPGMFAPLGPRFPAPGSFAPKVPRPPTPGMFAPLAPRVPVVPGGVPAAPPTARVVDAQGAGIKAAAGKGTAAAPLPADITDMLKRFTEGSPESSRKTLEFRVDRELMDAAMGAAAAAVAASGADKPKPEAPTPASARQTVELDASWPSIEGQDEPFADHPKPTGAPSTDKKGK